VRRRAFVAGLAAAATWPIVAEAQQDKRVQRVGALFGGSGSRDEQVWFDAFVRRLDELGWKQELNVAINLRWERGSADQVRATAVELLAWRPDVILAFTNTALAELKPIAGSVPIIFVGVADPVGSGFVESLARPGGNITGFESFMPALGGKWLALLKETAPSITRVLVLVNPETAAHQSYWRSIQKAAMHLGVDVTAANVHDAAEILDAITPFASKPYGGLVPLPHAVTLANSELIVALELRYRLPGVFGSGVYGSLVSYGVDWPDEMRRAAEYVNRILRGAKPTDLPVQSPTNFLLTINLKTAKALGIDVPPSVLSRADKVIE
jgi:putative tryptophan/tyrosine transport system substrate-binding protein